jgi:hypothetical protein
VRNSTFQDNRPPSRSQRTRGKLSPDAEGSHHVPRRPAVESGQRRFPWYFSAYAHPLKQTCRARLLRAHEDSRRATDPYSGPSGTNVSHHTAAPAYGLPVPTAHHASSATFVHKDLHNCTHVFFRQDATRRAPELPYSGPYQVLSRKEKTLQLLVRGNAVTVSADRVKPAYVLNEADCGSTIFNPLASATPDIAPPPATQATCSGRRVRFPARLST